MSAKSFLDTNILLYACSSAKEDSEKKRISSDLILNNNFALSSQVIQEFFANALHNTALGITETGIDATLKLASRVPVQPVNLELIIKATTLRRRFQTSHWDSTIIAAALELSCDTLYSEDLSRDQVFGNLRVVNPFA